MKQDEIQQVARTTFGWEHLRPAQLEAIQAAVSGQDVLAVLATGYGKSAVYQVAAQLREGITVVVSPLIALQEDQIAGLRQAPDAPEAVALHSAGGARRTKDAWRRLRSGEAEYVLLAPEQLAKEDVQQSLAELEVSMLVVDEAHCIASWGHDFRPDYLLIGAAAERLGRPPIVALTATASTPVREEIVTRLGLRDPRILLGDIDRPNIELAVRRYAEDGEKRAAVLAEVAEAEGTGLLYVATRRETESYAEELVARGKRAAAYHGGLPARERDRVHREFLDGSLDVVCATSAFGMGIDKEDVRFVVHADAPESVDAYYQEMGRAGRDGEPARATLHYRPEDLALRRYFATKRPGRAELSKVVAALGQSETPRTRLVEATGLSARRVTALLTLLVDTATARLGRRGARLRGGVDAERAVEQALERVEERERIDRSRIEMLRSYAETRRCRRQVLLGYFGQPLDEPCGNCDTCAAGSAFEEAAAPDRGWQVDERVDHEEWGPGTVMEVEDDRMTVFFESAGYKTLALRVVEENEVLRSAS
ncbi:RecQ family ATP-dependent DNA helicase [Microbacterium sp. JZ31]|uniref:RecQ family ATP-dependent DNA helicase n=1 Tax=Microbacterium sp. JZ31 TaxID=1906274 RepID=UPI001934B4C9|nr:RecQ family ATP-dependent DNA helicase [Microbacterium sp. JZ31]